LMPVAYIPVLIGHAASLGCERTGRKSPGVAEYVPTQCTPSIDILSQIMLGTVY